MESIGSGVGTTREAPSGWTRTHLVDGFRVLAVGVEGGGGVLEGEVELAHAEVALGAVSERGGVGGVGGDGLAVLDRRGAVIPRAEQLVPRVAERIALFRRAGALLLLRGKVHHDPDRGLGDIGRHLVRTRVRCLCSRLRDGGVRPVRRRGCCARERRGKGVFRYPGSLRF